MRAKITENKFVGQPILKQLLNFIPCSKFDGLVRQQQSDRYYNTFDAWTQLTMLLFGILNRCEPMGEICDGMRGLAKNSINWGLDKPPALQLVLF